jgi:hypothetical protein
LEKLSPDKFRARARGATERWKSEAVALCLKAENFRRIYGLMGKDCATGKISNPKDAEFILASGWGRVNEYLPGW